MKIMETKIVCRKFYPQHKNKCYCHRGICDCLTVNKIDKNNYRNKYFCVHTNNDRVKNNITEHNNSEYRKIKETTLSSTSTSTSSQSKFVQINCQLTRTSQQQQSQQLQWNLEKSMKNHWTDLIRCECECLRYIPIFVCK